MEEIHRMVSSSKHEGSKERGRDIQGEGMKGLLPSASKKSPYPVRSAKADLITTSPLHLARRATGLSSG